MAGTIIPGDRIIFVSPKPTSVTADRQAATTSFVVDQLRDKANVNSPAFTGNPTCSTPPTLDISDTIANAEYVKAVLSGIFQPITAPNIHVPTLVSSRSKMNKITIMGSKSQRSPVVRYIIRPVTGFNFQFSKTENIIDGEVVYFDALIATRDTTVLFEVVPTDGVLIGDPVTVSVIVKEYTG